MSGPQIRDLLVSSNEETTVLVMRAHGVPPLSNPVMVYFTEQLENHPGILEVETGHLKGCQSRGLFRVTLRDTPSCGARNLVREVLARACVTYTSPEEQAASQGNPSNRRAGGQPNPGPRYVHRPQIMRGRMRSVTI